MDLKSLRVEMRGPIAVVTLSRPDRRNAIDEATVEEIGRFFEKPPEGTKVIVLTGEGPHFCAGLDLEEHARLGRTPVEFMRMCQRWHWAFDQMQFGGTPVIGALQGAVVGGGLEIAAACHSRVADETTFFALPEGQRAIFTGGGATVRVGRIIGAGRMVDMMLAARTYDAKRGLDLGLCHEIVPPGRSLERALEIAEAAAKHAPLSNYAMVTAISRINDMSTTDGLFAESLMAGIVQSGPEVAAGLAEFLEKRAKRLETR
ncbi:crotonase/enoyl-CoA hydratase family protein [Enterovirga rhinocerotis]|uniref:Methylthioacryloyl-CoA hydratase n=1 Tax=Enterovirga rhinocerotis TaxID=1339210 RepID=A0A4R7C8H0_9HYPH|nr:crotonase/enoyl-CoA hydratase family protein [Enterovirga rhinocerotis]TDR94738.1 methylthioacryloyl-CoA hydratase [Enterovirga rhinocerotis]